jgi:preprotein translocase subunit SecB
MSDDSSNGGGTGQAAEQARPPPQIRMLSQYVKDISFESPRPPKQLPHAIEAPQININVNANAVPLDEARTQFEVELKLEARATKNDEVVFIAELAYGAVIQLINVGDDIKQPLTLIEGPRIIFPFARRILADLVRDGGFPPLMIEPIDFAALYRGHLARQQAAAAQA